MRTFNFRVRNIGEEKYLSYTMGEDCELDEDVLDYCQDHVPEELIEIIYEEDDDYDYLTYPVTGKVTLEDFIKEEHNCENVLLILRNVAQEMISLKEQAIPLSYVLLNRSFIYVDVEKKTVRFLCLPIESKGALAAEFKGFVRQLLANMKYDVEEDLSYVGKLLTYINGDNFNLRGLIGLAEALMEEEGISFEETGAIDADGVEVVSAEETTTEKIDDIMSSLQTEADMPLPEIGDDEEDEEVEVPEEEAEKEEELDSILPAGMQTTAPEKEADEETFEKPEAMAAADVEPEMDEEPQPEAEEASELEPMPQPEAAPESEAMPQPEAEEEKPEVPQAAEQILSQVNPETDTNAGEKLQLKTNKKESDINLIKDRIKELVGEVPSAKQTTQPTKNIQTLEDLDHFLDKPPVVKRNVVKVNRAAIIQQTEAEVEAAEAEAAQAEANAAEEPATQEDESKNANGMTENIKVPVIEDIYDDMNIEKKEDDDKKPKSTSILNKSVSDLVKDAVGAVSAAATATPKAAVPKALPYLIRESTEERIMLNKAIFKIGKATRGVDYTVGGNGAISRQHAFIIQKDGVCYIKDNKSTNHTYVNGKRVEDGAEEILTHDSIVRLADEEFMFKIR